MNNLLEIEEQVIGTYASNPDLFENCSHLISEHLFTGINRVAYVAIKNNHSKSVITDAILLLNELKKIGYSQSDLNLTATKLTTSNPQVLSNPIPKVCLLFEELIRVRMLPILNEASGEFESGSGDVFATIDKIKNKITDIEGVLNNVARERNIRDIFDEAFKRITDRKDNIVESTGFTFGVRSLDEKTGGICQGVNVVAAMPGGGKTTLLVNIVKSNAVDKNVPCVFFSLEMPAVEIMTNVIANVTEINSRALRQGDVDKDNILSIGEIRNRLKDNFIIDDKGGITWQYVAAKFRSYRKKHKIPKTQTILGMIDFLQLMGSVPEEYKGTTKEERIERICNELATICKNENIALVLLSQFSRQEKDRKVPRPKMSDLKGSAAIEACAILILLMFRPEYHGIFTDENGTDLRGLCEINIAKGRYVNPEPVYVRFLGRYSQFKDLDSGNQGINNNSEEPAF